jgi:hypothetical protein
MSVAAKKRSSKNFQVKYRVCFGEDGPKYRDLLGMRIVEYFITADNTVPFHVYVASREKFRCVVQEAMQTSSVIPSTYDSVQIVNGDGRTQEFAFTKFTVSIQSQEPNIKVDLFPCQDFNDTAFVFFGSGNEEDKAVRGAVVTPVHLFQAYERFWDYARLCGPAFRDDMVPWKEFPPTTLWKSSFPIDACSHQHQLMIWANSPVQETVMPDGIVKFTDADGQSMTLKHHPCNDPQWGVCSVWPHDKLPENGFQMAMPVALTAPFQVSFPGCLLPGAAAAKERESREATSKRLAAASDCNCRATIELNTVRAILVKLCQHAVVVGDCGQVVEHNAGRFGGHQAFISAGLEVDVVKALRRVAAARQRILLRTVGGPVHGVGEHEIGLFVAVALEPLPHATAEGRRFVEVSAQHQARGGRHAPYFQRQLPRLRGAVLLRPERVQVRVEDKRGRRATPARRVQCNHGAREPARRNQVQRVALLAREAFDAVLDDVCAGAAHHDCEPGAAVAHPRQQPTVAWQHQKGAQPQRRGGDPGQERRAAHHDEEHGGAGDDARKRCVAPAAARVVLLLLFFSSSAGVAVHAVVGEGGAQGRKRLVAVQLLETDYVGVELADGGDLCRNALWE